MTKGKLMKAKSFISGGALAIALAGLVTADLAAAADRPGRSGDGQRGGWSERSQDRGGQDRGNWQYRATRSEQAAPATPAPEPVRTDSRPARNWNNAQPTAVAEQPRVRPAERPTRTDGDRGSWRGGRNRDQDQVRQRDTSRENIQQNWRGSRDDNVRNGQRDSWRGNTSRGESWRGDHRDRRDWDRSSWRRDNRYDWQRYRDSHRSNYRIGRYYAPYHNYSYRRLGIGFSLGSMFYGRNYWINDPWSYRLPEVYGPYRWVRYYDDVLLVDTYTGEVVDVIYDFFW